MTEKHLRKALLPFGIVAAIWACVGFGASRYFSDSSETHRNLVWFAGLWLLCVCDLLVLAKTVQGLFALASGNAEKAENRPLQVIQTFSWGFLKLVCLGIFTLVMMKGRPFPMPGLLSGLGTLVVVPLLGGLIWGSKILGVSDNGRAFV